MIGKTDIIQVAKSFMRHQRGRGARHFIHPYREWRIGLIALVLVVLAGASYAFWLYLSYANLDDITGQAATVPPTYQSVAAETAIEALRERQLTYQSLSASYEVLVVTPATSTATTTVETATVSELAATSSAEIE